MYFLKVGNSSLALREDEGPIQKIFWRSKPGEIRKLLAKIPHVSEIWVASVVPDVTEQISALSKKRGLKINLLEVQDFRKFPIAYRDTIGIDRVLNLFGAAQIFPHQAFVVIDLGTAMTIDFYHPIKGHLGGWILPGLQLLATALHHGTAQLPNVKNFTKPVVAGRLGKNTRESLEFAQIAMLRGIWSEIERNAFKHLKTKRYKIVLTGGGAQEFLRVVSSEKTDSIPNVHVMPDLIFTAMKIFYHDRFNHRAKTRRAHTPRSTRAHSKSAQSSKS